MREVTKVIYKAVQHGRDYQPNNDNAEEYAKQAVSEIEALLPKVHKFDGESNAPENDGWYYATCLGELFTLAYYSAKDQKWFDSSTERYREEIKDVKYYTYRNELSKLLPEGEG